MAPLIDHQQVVAVAGVPEEIDFLSWATDDRTEELTLIADPVSANDGSVEDVGEGRVVYTAEQGFHGNDSFGFRVRDEHGLETAGTAYIEVMLGRMARCIQCRGGRAIGDGL